MVLFGEFRKEMAYNASLFLTEMRIVLLFCLLLHFYKSPGQTVPPDHVILKKIYGKVDKSNNSYTRPGSEEQDGEGRYNPITYKVAYSAIVHLRNSDILFIITKAETAMLHGHVMGYEDYYFFKQKGNDYSLIGSVKSDSDNFIGDENDYTIIEIGKGKKALISTFLSTGNHHLEVDKNFYLLDIGKLTPLLTLDLEYSNEGWKVPENATDDCEAEKFEDTFEIVKSNNEWYDIKVHHVEYGFTKGCEESYVAKETDLIYRYKNDKYIERK